jgi:predicted RNA-binding Zn ribbon-like protein
MSAHNFSEPTVTRDDMLLALTHLRSAIKELREAESQWEPTAMLLALEVFDMAAELNIDVDNLYDVELHLLGDIKMIEGKLQLGYGSHWNKAAKTAMYAKEEKLAAVRDLSNTLDWLTSPNRAVVIEPRCSTIPSLRDLIRDVAARIKSGKMREKELDDFHSQVLAAAIAVSGKAASLESELRKVKKAAEIVGSLSWRPDDAPLMAILLFN